MRESTSESAIKSIESLLATAGDQFLTPDQARAEAGLRSVQTIYNWLNDRVNPLPADKAGSKLWRIPRSQLLAYMRARGNRPKGGREAVAETALHRGVAGGVRVARAAIDFKRASLVYRAAIGSFDLEWHEISYADMNEARERLFSVLDSVSEQSLSALEMALPYIDYGPAVRGEGGGRSFGPKG